MSYFFKQKLLRVNFWRVLQEGILITFAFDSRHKTYQGQTLVVNINRKYVSSKNLLFEAK